MTSQSIIFDFIRTPDFIKNMNRSTTFDVLEMDGTTKNYKFEFATDCGGDITDCLNADGTLKRTGQGAVTVLASGNNTNIGTSNQVALTYSTGVNNNATISLGASAVTIDVGDVDVFLKGLFLVDKNTDYVLAYCILTRTVPITNEVVLPASGLVWNIRNEV